MDYADQRFYASSYGRFNTPDPSGSNENPASSGSWNQYSYTQGDPINGRDPTGLMACFEAEYASSDCDTGGGLSGIYGGGSNCSFLAGLGFVRIPGPGCYAPAGIAVVGLTGGSSAPAPQCPLVSLVGRFNVKPGVIALFAPDIASKIDAALVTINAAGFVPTITEGFRTESMQEARQDGPYGAAPVGQSSHEIGEAIDIRWLVPGTDKPVAGWEQIKAALLGQGLTWGGNWRKKDPVHFENVHKPDPNQVAACEREHP